MLEQNRSLQSLNLESNFITSAGMLRLLAAIGRCPTLSELRVDNQVTAGTAGTGTAGTRSLRPSGTARCSARSVRTTG